MDNITYCEEHSCHKIEVLTTDGIGVSYVCIYCAEEMLETDVKPWG